MVNIEIIKIPSISVVIPAYNEEKRIANTIIETCYTMKSFSMPYEVIVVNDGSSDRTYEEASRAAEQFDNVKVVHYTQNGGKGNAVKFGCKFVTGDYVTFLDADLDLHPRQLKNFFDYIYKYNVDIVVGSKRHPLSKVNYPAHRKILSWLYHIGVKIMFQLPVNDTQLGLKVYRREVIQEILPKMLVKRFAYDLEVLATANRKGFKIGEAPVELNFRRKMGRIKLRDITKIAQDTIAIFYRMHILKYYDEKVSPDNRQETNQELPSNKLDTFLLHHVPAETTLTGFNSRSS